VSKERSQMAVESPFETVKKIPDVLVTAGEAPQPVRKSAAGNF